jgi:hypothetical protein
MEQNSSKVDPNKYSKQFLTKEQKQYCGENAVFSTNGAGTTLHSHAK